jgi:hypothetical protein
LRIALMDFCRTAILGNQRLSFESFDETLIAIGSIDRRKQSEIKPTVSGMLKVYTAVPSLGQGIHSFLAHWEVAQGSNHPSVSK